MYDNPVPLHYPVRVEKVPDQTKLTEEELDPLKDKPDLFKKDPEELPLEEYSPLERFVKDFQEGVTMSSKTASLLWAVRHHGHHARVMIDEQLRTSALQKIFSLGFASTKKDMLSALYKKASLEAKEQRYRAAAEYFCLAAIVDTDLMTEKLWPEQGSQSGQQQRYMFWDAVKQGPKAAQDAVVKYHLGSNRVFKILRKAKSYHSIAIAIIELYDHDLKAEKIHSKHSRDFKVRAYTKREQDMYLRACDSEWGILQPTNMFIELPFHLQRAINSYAENQSDKFKILKRSADTNDEGVSISDRLMMIEYIKD